MKNLTQRKNDFADLLKSYDVSKFDDAFASLNKLFADFNKNTNKAFADFRKNVNELFDDFDYESVEKAIEKGKSSLLKNLKRTPNNDFEVVVDFDKDTDNLSFELKNNDFSVLVESKDKTSASSFTTTIPNDVDKHSVVQKYDSVNKKIRFVFKKLN